jgi:cytochrome c biogenesis protein CcmG, thiol:disulfide interchange protein DsbE
MRSPGRWRAVLLGGVVVTVLTVAALLTSALSRPPTVAASPLVGRQAPNFRLEGLNGPPVRLSDLRGQVVVVNFWASWCAECRVEQPALDATWKRFRDSGVVVVGVDFQDQTADAQDYLAEFGSSYPVVRDAESSTALAYGLRGVPETFVVDRSGKVVDRVIGPVDADVLAGRILRTQAGTAS